MNAASVKCLNCKTISLDKKKLSVAHLVFENLCILTNLFSHTS